MTKNRRNYIFALLSKGVKIDYQTKREFAQRFGCSEQTIHHDIKLYLATEDDKAFQYILRRKFTCHQSRARQYNAIDTLDWDDFIQLFERANGVCTECGVNIGRQFLVPDHIVSLGDGGSNSIDNLRAICSICNMRKN